MRIAVLEPYIARAAPMTSLPVKPLMSLVFHIAKTEATE
jgi:hypothetical protein